MVCQGVKRPDRWRRGMHQRPGYGQPNKVACATGVNFSAVMSSCDRDHSKMVMGGVDQASQGGS